MNILHSGCEKEKSVNKQNNKQNNKRGSAMLEAVIAVMIFVMLASSLYALSGMEHRYVLSKMKEDEAYYAAVSAVRLMAQEVVSGDDSNGTAVQKLTSGTGMKKCRTSIVFEPKDSDETVSKAVEIPVTVWSKREKDELILAARAEVGGKTKVVTMKLLKTEDISEENVENREIAKMASDSNAGEISKWVPISYGLEPIDGIED